MIRSIADPARVLEILAERESLSPASVGVTREGRKFLKGDNPSGLVRRDASSTITRAQLITALEKRKIEYQDGYESRVLDFVATDESVDRAGDIVSFDGWDFADYDHNPIMTWSHSYDTMPVGTGVGRRQGKSIAGKKAWVLSKLFFPPEVDEESDHVFRAYKAGLLNATSVGFIPLAFAEDLSKKERQEAGLGANGYLFTRQSLLELAAVPLPMNANALLVQNGVKSGLIRREDASWLEKAIGADIAQQLEDATRIAPGKIPTIQREIHQDEDLFEEKADVPAEESPAPSEEEASGDLQATTVEGGYALELRPASDFGGDMSALQYATEPHAIWGKVGTLVDTGAMAYHALFFMLADGWTTQEVDAYVVSNQDAMASATPDTATANTPGGGSDQPAGDMGRALDELREIFSRDDADPLRWNPALSKAFDITRERYEAASIEYAAVSAYLDCEIKDLHVMNTAVPSARIGSFLSALEEMLGFWRVEDIRNLTYGGKEAPPINDLIQLNSTMSADFLIDGIRFIRSTQDAKEMMALKVEPMWYGLQVTTYVRSEHSEIAHDFIDAAWSRAKDLNFLKGEAFSLSGDFLAKTGESFADLCLDPTNALPVKRAVTLINEKGTALPNRGLLFMGPPGTGKTLSGRVMMNEANATFIWISARDFYRAGAFGGISYGFELARECAPSILFIEDVDNWLDARTIDLLKTEMDGIGRSSGVITVLTTNYPERLPKALIDRPGRFHDVLKFDLPAPPIRKAMLQKWLPGLGAAELESAVKSTNGYSGAHIRELANFVSVIQDQEGLSIAQSLVKALAKLEEQRELIDEAQSSDSRYRPGRVIGEAIKCASLGNRITGIMRTRSIVKAAQGTTPTSDGSMAAIEENSQRLVKLIESLASRPVHVTVTLDSDALTALSASVDEMRAEIVDLKACIGDVGALARAPRAEPSEPPLNERLYDTVFDMSRMLRQGNSSGVRQNSRLPIPPRQEPASKPT